MLIHKSQITHRHVESHMSSHTCQITRPKSHITSHTSQITHVESPMSNHTFQIRHAKSHIIFESHMSNHTCHITHAESQVCSPSLHIFNWLALNSLFCLSSVQSCQPTITVNLHFSHSWNGKKWYILSLLTPSWTKHIKNMLLKNLFFVSPII